MLKKLKTNRKSNKKEEGQSMIEFAFVLPVFMLLIVIILDYGWLFYNQIQLENCARNAARVACVEYKETCLDPLTGEAYASGAKQKFDLSRLDASESQSTDPLTDQEKDILKEVKRTLPSSVSDVEVYIEYTYDGDYLDGTYSTQQSQGGRMRASKRDSYCHFAFGWMGLRRWRLYAQICFLQIRL